jgi:hypothetical protein
MLDREDRERERERERVLCVGVEEENQKGRWRWNMLVRCVADGGCCVMLQLVVAIEAVADPVF